MVQVHANMAHAKHAAINEQARRALKEELSNEYNGKVKVAKLDVDSNPQTATNYGIRGIPTLLMFKDGSAVDQIVGAVPKTHIAERLDKIIT